MLVALDIDSTLATATGQVPAANAAAVRRVRALGVRFVLATGRSPRSAARFARELGLATPLICLWGAWVGYPGARRALRLAPIPEPAATAVLAATRGLPSIAVTDDDWFAHAPDGVDLALGPLGTARPVPDLGQAVAASGRPLLLVSVVGPAAAEAARSGVDTRGLSLLRWSHWVGTPRERTNFLAAGADKSLALAWLAAIWRVPAESVLACGDDPVDRGMLGWAGHSLAMAWADADLRRLARRVGSDRADAVAVELDRLWPA